MATYFRVQAKLQYTSKEAFEKAIKLLETLGVYGHDEEDDVTGFRSEKASGIFAETEDYIDDDNLTITIPNGYYRNLARYIEELYEGIDAQSDSYFCWTSTDGMFNGGYSDKSTSFEDEETDLITLASDPCPDWITNSQEATEWQNDIENRFFEQKVAV